MLEDIAYLPRKSTQFQALISGMSKKHLSLLYSSLYIVTKACFKIPYIDRRQLHRKKRVIKRKRKKKDKEQVKKELLKMLKKKKENVSKKVKEKDKKEIV